MSDPLPSWNEGAAKWEIVDFVSAVSTEGHPDFVPVPARVAVFDNDGTLWCEQPLQVQFFFGHHRLEKLAEEDPSLRERQPYKAFLERDEKAIRELGKQGLFEVGAAAHSGMTEGEFDHVARKWLKIAEHPKLQRPFTQLVYQPQLELLDYLRANGFKTFVVSGGGIDLIRAFAEEVYGIPPEQVIGSSVKTRFEMQGQRGELVKLPELFSFDDREVKVANIGLHIGRRPIFVFGNSDGDLAMMRYTKSGLGRRLALLLHHDDASREFSYDRDFHLSPLAEALDHADEFGFRVISMKDDWAKVFSPAP